MQSILYYDLAHHELEADDHDVQQAQLLGHPKSQALIRKELHANMDHTIAQCVRIDGSLQHHGYSTVVEHKRPS